MANVKITDLSPATTPLTGTELFEVVQGDVSLNVPASDIATASSIPFGNITNRAYASFCDTTDQTGSISARTALKLNTVNVTGSGITVVTDGSNLTRITYSVTGAYMMAVSLQLVNSDSNDHDITVWFAKNGTNLANSATRVTVPKAADGGAAIFQIVEYLELTAGDYIQVMWLPENVAVTIDYTAAGAIAPAVPSAIVVTERIA